MGAPRLIDRRTARIPCGPGAPSQARRWAAWLAGAVPPRTAEWILIAVSELVANAVVHAGLPPGAPIEVRAEVHPDRVTLMVRDRGAGLPATPAFEPPPADACGPRGLFLVSRLTTRMLIDPAAGSVTCEFAR